MFDEVENGQQYIQQEAQSEQPQVTQQQTEEKSVQSQKENNLRILRERAEAAERRAQELERIVQMNMNQNKPSTKIEVIEEEQDDFDISDDSYIEGKHLKKSYKNLKQEFKKTKEEFREYMAKAALTEAEIRLKAQYSDFYDVVNQEAMNKLQREKPHIYKSILSNNDIYERGCTAYDFIKNSGFTVQKEEYTDQDKRLDDNRTKPRSLASAAPQTSDTPLTRVGDYDRRELTEERKAQLRRQVEQAKMMR